MEIVPAVFSSRQ